MSIGGLDLGAAGIGGYLLVSWFLKKNHVRTGLLGFGLILYLLFSRLIGDSWIGFNDVHWLSFSVAIILLVEGFLNAREEKNKNSS